MKLLGNLLAKALLALGVTQIPAFPVPEPHFRGPTPGRRRAKDRVPYGLGLLEPQRARNQKRMEKIHPLRDEHGAFTLTGRGRPEIDGARPRRQWLAGVSAQRGC